MYNYISFGYDCYPAFALRELGLRPYALPFDWVVSSADSIVNCISTDFNYFHKDLEFCDDKTLSDIYGFSFLHDYPFEEDTIGQIHGETFFSGDKIVNNWKDFYEENRSKYARRIQRFHDIMNSPEHLFALFKGDIFDIEIIRDVLKKKYGKTNVTYVVFSFDTSDDYDVVTCNPTVHNYSHEWMNAIEIGKSRLEQKIDL